MMNVSHVSKKVLHRKKEPENPWITKGLLKSINTKNKFYKEYVNNPSPQRTQNFKTYWNKLHSLIWKAKRECMFKKLKQTKGNMKKTLNMINKVFGHHKKITIEQNFKEDNMFVIKPSDVANEFNDFFVNIGPKLAEKIHTSGKR